MIENKHGYGQQKYIITSEFKSAPASPELDVLFAYWSRPSSHFMVGRLARIVSVM